MTTTSCACTTCRDACHKKPGWFLPAEAEHAAELMGLDLQTFFERYLAVDWYEADGLDERITEDTFLLAPGIVGEGTGTEYPGDPEGRCVFLDANERCTIYAARPHECAEYLHGQPHELMAERHANVALTWVEHQGQISALLGREPFAQEYHGSGILGLLGIF